MAQKKQSPAADGVRRRGLAKGYRSGLEDAVAHQLHTLKTLFSYEGTVVYYVKPARVSRYTPDFLVLNNGILVETKGLFTVEDRQKHLLIKEQHPGLDIRFVFSNPRARLSKGSSRTYAMWAKKHGFLFATARIPAAWLEEPPIPARFEAIAAAASSPEL